MNRLLRYARTLEQALPWLVLAVLSLYTYHYVADAPYIGFHFVTPEGMVTAIYEPPSAANDLAAGDLLKQVESVPWSAYLSNLRQPLFPAVKSGQTLSLQIERAGTLRTVSWHIPPPTRQERLGRLVDVWWLAYLFWLAGTATLVLVRPKDSRWRLLIAFYFLTALWLMFGTVSRWVIGDSAILLRVAIWLCLPIYLHLHWLFPSPLPPLPRWLWSLVYLGALFLVHLQWGQHLPADTYLYGFLVALLGSLLLLLAHFLRQPSERSKIRWLVLAFVLAFVPNIVLTLAQLEPTQPWTRVVSLLALPLIPGSYFYTAYSRQLAGQALRVNRLISFYLFFLLLGTLTFSLLAWAMLVWDISSQAVAVSLVATSLVSVISLFGFAPFQRVVERRILGIPLLPTALLETYPSRIATNLDLPNLIRLLSDEVLPSLLIRQSALLHVKEGDTVSVVYQKGVSHNQLPDAPALADLLASLKHAPQRFASPISCNDWVRLALPLRIGGQTIGIWLLGQHDPDNIYTSAEITVFQALADQTAIALANIEQTNQLRAFHQANIARQERERSQLARVLHEEVLHEMALLSWQIGESEAAVQFEQSYQVLKERIRQIIIGLRPAMMSYGLAAALEELCDDLSDRTGIAVTLHLHTQQAGVRYPSEVEQHLFRILQQACENAIRHAAPTLIQIEGSLAADNLSLSVKDSGKGFVISDPLDVPKLLADKHFGLVGMQERATLIRANLSIQSIPAHGTQVTITWRDQGQPLQVAM